ncbi:MAG: hypothetical protein ACK5WZ_03760, partial [Pseudobdellovibrionaceae bacterium]
SYVVAQTPTPPSGVLRNLEIFSDKPGDLIIRNHKRSLQKVDLAELGVNQDQLKAYYQRSMSGLLSAAQIEDLSREGFDLYKNFIHGILGRNAYEALETRDHGQFWVMVMPRQARIDSALLQLEMFGNGIGGHTQLRFKLNTPLLLIPQEKMNQFPGHLSENKSAKVIQRIDGQNIRSVLGSLSVSENQDHIIPGDVVYTLMALRTDKGHETWGPLTGLTGSFANSFSLASTAHMASVQANHSFIQQFELKLTSTQKQNLLNYVLTYSNQEKERQIYNVIYNSCIQATMRALDFADRRVDEWEFSPYSVVSHLASLGLIIPAQELDSVNAEFDAPMKTLETEENKASLDFLRKNMGLIQSAVFKDSLKVLALVIIEDRWTYNELNLVFDAIKSNAMNGSINVAQAQSQLQINPSIKQKSAQSIIKIIQSVEKILKDNKVSLQFLLETLKNLNGGN